MAIAVDSRTSLTRDEAAELLGVSVRTIDRLRARGRLHAVQYLRRGRVRYRLADVEALLEPEAREPHPVRSDELDWH